MGVVINLNGQHFDDKFKYKVYKISFLDGKCYIGATSSPVTKRVGDHISEATTHNSNRKIHDAIRKNLKLGLNVEVIAGYDSEADMYKAEAFYISKYDSFYNGYNSTTGGKRGHIKPMSREDRVATSVAQKLRFSNPEERLKAAEATKKWQRDNPDKLREMCLKRTAAVRKPEVKEKIRDSLAQFRNKNPGFTKKVGEKISANYKNDPTLTLRISQALGGKPIEVYTLNGDYVTTYPTLSELGRSMGVSTGNVSSVLAGQRNHCGGYFFKRSEG